LLGKEMLVVDNCEHLLDAAAKVVDALLAACPRLRVLATSREPLSLAGVVIRRVSSLSMPDPDRLPAVGELTRHDAACLFLNRIRLRLPNFELTPEKARGLSGTAVRRTEGRAIAAANDAGDASMESRPPLRRREEAVQAVLDVRRRLDASGLRGVGAK
jgi:predicted ATPase